MRIRLVGTLEPAESFFRLLDFGALNRVRFLLSMRCTLLGYSFEPRPSSFALGSMCSVITIGLSINGCLHLKKPVWRERTRWSSPEVQAVATSKAWSNYLGKASYSSFHSRRQKEARARMVVRCNWNWIFKDSIAHEAKQDTYASQQRQRRRTLV